jgi:hypothetical protein
MSPNLTHLILDDRPERNRFSTSAVLGEDVLRALTGASNSTYDTDGPLCPLLQRIGFCDRYACETGLILDFLQSRFYPAAGTQIASLNHASIYSLRPYVLIDSALQAFNEKETPTPTLKDLECALGLKAIERPVSLLACNTVTERNDKVYVFYPTAKTFARSPLNQFEIDEYFAVEPNEHNEFPYSMSF